MFGFNGFELYALAVSALIGLFAIVQLAGGVADAIRMRRYYSTPRRPAGATMREGG